MEIIINGEKREYSDGMSVQNLIDKLDIEDRVMATAVNMEVVKKENWTKHRLKNGDRVEFLHFVGGGIMIVAIDVGLKRIGIAISPDGSCSIPQNPIIRKGRKQASKDITNLLKSLNAKILIVGIPRGSHSEKEMERRIKYFVSLIDTENISIYYQDEAGSSSEAKESIKGVAKQKRDGKIDSISASIILQRWLDSRYLIKK